MNQQVFSVEFLLEEGIITIQGPINNITAQNIINQLLYLSYKYPKRPIKLYINSPGGEIDAGFAIYDTMNYIDAPVYTVGLGMVASMAAFLLAAGEKGKRVALPNTRILIHQPLAGISGQATDIILAAQNIEKVKIRINKILADNTNQDIKKIGIDCERDYVMIASEAKEYGLIDFVLEKDKKFEV